MITDRNAGANRPVERANNDLPTGNAPRNPVALEVERRLSNSNGVTGTSTKA